MVEDGDDVEGLRRVGAGLRLVLLGLAATVAVELGFAVAMASVVNALPIKPNGDVAATFQALRRPILLRTLSTDRPGAATALNAAVVLAYVLGIAGKVFCARGPDGVGAAFAVSSIVFDGLGLGLYAAGQASPLGEASAELGDLAPLGGIMAYFLFLRYLGRLAEHLGSPRLRTRVRRQQIGSLALLLAAFVAGGLVGSGQVLGLALSVGIGVGMIAMFVLFLRLILESRRVVERAAEHS